MPVIGAGKGHPEQLPAGEIVEHFGLGAGDGHAAFWHGDGHAAVGGVDPRRRFLGQLGDVGCDLAADGLCGDYAKARHDNFGPLLGQEAHNCVTAKVCDDQVATCDPIGARALGVGALALSLHGIAHFARFVASRDVRLIGPAVRGQRDGVVPIRALGQARNVERHKDISKVGKDDDRHGEGLHALHRKGVLRVCFGSGKIDGGHWFCPSVRRLR